MAKGSRVFGPSRCPVLTFRPWLWLSWRREREVSVKVPRSVCHAGEVLSPLLLPSPAETIPLNGCKHGDGCEHPEVSLRLKAAPASQHLRLGSEGRVSRRGSLACMDVNGIGTGRAGGRGSWSSTANENRKPIEQHKVPRQQVVEMRKGKSGEGGGVCLMEASAKRMSY